MSGMWSIKWVTLQVAICARAYHVPFYAFIYGPDRSAPTPEQVVMEERDPNETLYCLGKRTANFEGKGVLPGFLTLPRRNMLLPW